MATLRDVFELDGPLLVSRKENGREPSIRDVILRYYDQYGLLNTEQLADRYLDAWLAENRENLQMYVEQEYTNNKG